MRALRNLAETVRLSGNKKFPDLAAKIMPSLLTATQQASSERRADYLLTVKECFEAAGNEELASKYLRMTLKKILSSAQDKSGDENRVDL